MCQYDQTRDQPPAAFNALFKFYWTTADEYDMMKHMNGIEEMEACWKKSRRLKPEYRD